MQQHEPGPSRRDLRRAGRGIPGRRITRAAARTRGNTMTRYPVRQGAEDIRVRETEHGPETGARP
jgi:hypothetical protein